MNLGFSQIQQFTVGAIFIDATDEGYAFRRFTSEQKEAFGATFPMWAVRSDYTSGIRIDFHTDADTVSVEVAAKGRYEVLVVDLCVQVHSQQHLLITVKLSVLTLTNLEKVQQLSLQQ